MVVVAAIFPFLWLLQMSLKTEVEAFKMPPQLIFVPSLANYFSLFDDKFVRAFSNSTLTATATTFVALLVGVPAAYALSRTRFRHGRLFSLWILFTRMVPPIAFGIPFFLIYRNLGLIDTLPGLTIIYLTFNLSLVVWMMRTFFDGLPRSLEEAAYVDGAGLSSTFLRITLPLSGPGIATTAILCFLMSWNDFFFALILTRSNAMTAPVAIVNFMNYQGWEWGKITAASTLVALPMLIIAFLVRKYLVQGLTAGALKG